MTKHTPGPWRLETNRAPNGGTYYRIFDADDARSCIAQVIGDGRIEYHDNAALIAAAPDLLAALQAFVVQRDKLAGFPQAVDPYSGAYVAARAAIAKAEGRE